MTDLERLLLNTLIEARNYADSVTADSLHKYAAIEKIKRWDQLIKDAEGM